MTHINISQPVSNFNSPAQELSGHSYRQSPERRVIAWLRQRISPLSWGRSDRDKSNFRFAHTKNYILKSYRARRLGGRGYFLKKMPLDLMMRHFCGSEIAYFIANTSGKCKETLAQIDIDCHNRGSFQGAIECVNWLRANGFPDLFWSRSTNRRGIHAYIRVDIRGEKEFLIDDAFMSLEKWLRVQLALNSWDVEGIEVKGRPMVRTWGDEKYELVNLSMGTLGKLPVEALDRPEELMATTLKSVRQLRILGNKAGYLERTLSEPVAASVDHPDLPEDCGFGEVDVAELRQDWTPDLRNREWPKWVMYVCQHGLQFEDNLGETLHELAKWFLWVELYGQADKREKAVELLDWFVSHKHNGRISRMTDGRHAEVTAQVRRAVKLAEDIEGKQVMMEIRHKRQTGKYAVVYEAAPLLCGKITPSIYSITLSGDDQPSEDLQGDGQEVSEKITPSIYSITLRSDPLPSDLETKLVQLAKANRMRKTASGEYPFMIFSRRLLNHLWDNKGSARLGQPALNQMAAAKKADQQVKYKTILKSAGLIKPFEGTYRSGTASTLYSLTNETLGALNDKQRQAAKTA